MKVLVWRSGGLLGRSVEWDVVVDEQPDSDQWYLLIAELPWDECPAVSATPDRYNYRIRCDPHEVVIPEQQLTGPWRELVDRVRNANTNTNTNTDADADADVRPRESEPVEPNTSCGADEKNETNALEEPSNPDGDN